MINFSYKLVHLRIIWDRSVSSWLVDDQHSILFRMPTNLALRGPLRSVTCEMPPRHPMASHRQQLKPIYSLWRVGQPGYCFCVFRSEFFAWATAADHVPNSNCNQARWPPRLLFPPCLLFLIVSIVFLCCLTNPFSAGTIPFVSLLSLADADVLRFSRKTRN